MVGDLGTPAGGHLDISMLSIDTTVAGTALMKLYSNAIDICFTAASTVGSSVSLFLC